MTRLILVIYLNIWFGGYLNAQDTLLVDFIHLPYSINTIANDSTGTIWVTGARGLEYYDFEREAFVQTNPDLKDKIIAIGGKVTPFRPYLKEGLRYYAWDQFDAWLAWVPPGTGRVSVAEDKFGRHWVSTGSQIFIFSVEDRFERILNGQSTRGIYQDGEDLYVNTYSGILKNGRPMFEKPFMGEGEIKQFGQDLYIAWGGLIRYQPRNETCNYLKFYRSYEYWRSPNPIGVQSLEKIKDTIWVGTNFGLGYVQKDSVVMVTNHPNIQDVIYYQNGLLIAGSRLLNPGLKKVYRPSHGLKKPDCENCRGVYFWQNNRLSKLDLPELNYWQILQADGRYFFASDSGIVVWDGTRVTSRITQQDGLTDNRTCAMALDDHGFLWVSTYSGLNRINLESGVITQYLKNIEFNVRSYLKYSDLLYFGSTNGLYHFFPQEFLGDDALPREHLPRSAQAALWVTAFLVFGSFGFLVAKFRNRKQSQRKTALIETQEKQLFLLQVKQYITHNPNQISVGYLAEMMGLSERSLYRKLKKYDLQPGELIRDLKIQKLEQLIQNDPPPAIKTLASATGYSEQYLKKILKDRFKHEYLDIYKA
ncbi:MAG: AraC family transcriptional regulator [Bacteroidetes bacterium]|nr:MAG: AraC family transcriptional regulator [Bacteroidota bacterium]